MSRYEILDPQRIVRPQERRIHWECSLRTRMKFRSLLAELVDLEQYSMLDLDVQQQMESLREEIRGLPGFPRGYDPERDLIVPVTTSAQR